ncbi:MAG TPA: hypothetical protein VF107_15080 [Burkholderiaceae bacterium]
MFDLFVCTNEVNQTVVLAGELRRAPRRALVLYDPVRCDRRAAPGVWQLPFGPWVDRLVRLLGRLGLLRTAYVPHQRVHARLMREVRRARALAYVDDGLDTLRRQPLNFDLAALPAARCNYLTFDEYRSFPPWLTTAFETRAVCSLHELSAGGRKPPLDLDGVDHLLVEAPGLDAGALIAALGLDPQRTLCVRHPVPHKRGALPPLCRAVEGRGHDLDATLAACRERSLYFGATMSLVVAVLTGVARHNRVFVQLDDQQGDNLMLPGRLEPIAASGLRNRLWRVHPPEGS